MATVYLAYDCEQYRQVAVKVLADALAYEPRFVQRFYREGSITRRLSHTHIVAGYGFGHDRHSGKHYIVLEHVDGPSLQVWLDDAGCMPLSQSVRIILEVASALEYLHSQQVVHRDIKPGNILLDPQGHVKLIDLGLAKRIDDLRDLTLADQGLGTSYYMPFEQARNPVLVDERSDIFALGATFYHLLTGDVPFVGDNHVEIARAKEQGSYRPAAQRNPAVTRELEAILARMMHRDPRQRYARAAELILDLQALSSDLLSPPSSPLTLPIGASSVLAEPGQTRVDLPLVPAPEMESTRWSIRYRRDGGHWLARSATTAEIMKWALGGLLPADVLVARDGQPQFRPLRAYPEFCQLPEQQTAPTVAAANDTYLFQLNRSRARLLIACAASMFLAIIAWMLLPSFREQACDCCVTPIDLPLPELIPLPVADPLVHQRHDPEPVKPQPPTIVSWGDSQRRDPAANVHVPNQMRTLNAQVPPNTNAY